MVNLPAPSLLHVERPEPYRLERAPLAQVVAQVRYPVIAHLQMLPGVAKLQDALQGAFPFMEQRQEQLINFNVSPGLPPQVQQSATTSWEFSSDEHPYRLVVDSASATLAVDGVAYEGSGALTSQFRVVIAALLEAEAVRRCDRIGLRFLNLHPTSGANMQEALGDFRVEFTGLLPAVASTSSVAGALSQLQVSSNRVLPDNSEVQAIIHTGLLAADSTLPGLPPVILAERSFLLDIDVFSMQGRQFRVDGLMDAFYRLHAEVDAIFAHSLTDTGRERFGFAAVAAL